MFRGVQAAEKHSYASLRVPDSLQRTEAYASAHRTSRALPLSLFEQPETRAFYQTAGDF
jgi:hypothetical protein